MGFGGASIHTFNNNNGGPKSIQQNLTPLPNKGSSLLVNNFNAGAN